MNGKLHFSTLRSLTALLATCCSLGAQAGTFSYNGGTWGSLTGSAVGTSAYTANNDVNGAAPSLTLTSLTANYTLQGTLSYSVLWTPASSTDTPPADAYVSWTAQSTLTASGTGSAEVSNGSGVLYEMDSTNNYLTGVTATLYTVTQPLPISLQPDGTYLAAGTLNSDSLATNYDSSGASIICSEDFIVSNIASAG